MWSKATVATMWSKVIVVTMWWKTWQTDMDGPKRVLRWHKSVKSLQACSGFSPSFIWCSSSWAVVYKFW
jgi:hypothetical protein